MKWKSFLIGIAYYFLAINSHAVDREALNRVIANPDIEIRTVGNSEKPQVRANLNKYKITSSLISRSDEFFLNNNDYGAEDSRLDVAHKNTDGSYNYTTLHLWSGKVHRATECKKKRSHHWGLKNKYSCYYASANVCKHIDTNMQKYMRTMNECRDMFKDLKQILPYEAKEIKDYKQFTEREMSRIRAFSKNSGIEKFPEFVNFEDLNEAQNKGLILFNEIAENIEVCHKFFPQSMSEILPTDKASPTRGSSLNGIAN